jgi:outer membrane protein
VRSTEKAVSITLNIPLFNGFADTYKSRNAQALVQQKEIELQATEQQSLLELVQQYAQAHASVNNLRAAAELYRAAAAAAQSAQRQYEHGAIDILQLNQTLTALQQAQDDLVHAQLEWSRARLALWLAQGPGRAP